VGEIVGVSSSLRGIVVSRFIGRDKELSDLKQLLQKKTASFVVIRGRRRIG